MRRGRKRGGRLVLHLHRGLPSWAAGAFGWGQAHSFMEALEDWWQGTARVHVHVYPRERMGDEAWWRRMYLTDPTLNPRNPNARWPGKWGCRAWCDHYARRVVILLDDTETTSSAWWLLVHELTHYALEQARFLRKMLAVEQQDMGQPVDWDHSDDAEHARNPEEQLCNRFATTVAGGNFDRAWWRARVRAHLAESEDK